MPCSSMRRKPATRRCLRRRPHNCGPKLGGFYLIQANDLDEALAWAAKMPSAKYGSIEVRPIWE